MSTPAPAKEESRPFAIQLEVEFLDRLSEPVRDGRAKSVSDLIRTALERFDLDNVVVVRPSQLLISVRLPASIRAKLKSSARTKHTSVGQLVRAAVEAYLPAIEQGTPGQEPMPIPHVELPPPQEETAKAPASTAPKRREKKKAAKPASKPALKPTKRVPKKPAAKLARKVRPKAKRKV